MALVTRYINTASSAGGDGTTPATSGANRAYSSLSEWESNENTDLDAANDNHVVNCVGTSADISGTVYVTGWTTSVLDNITVIGDNTDDQWNTAAYRMEEAGTCVYIQSPTDIEFQNCQFNNSTTSGDTIDFHGLGAKLTNCIVRGGLRNVYYHALADGDLENCILYDAEYGVWAQGATSTINFDNVLFDNSTSQVWCNSAATFNFNNCAIREDSVAGGAGTYNYTYCASESGLGSNAQTLSGTPSDDFVDVSINDYTPVGSGALAENGNSCPTNDITGSARTGTCDIGPINFVAVGGVTVPIMSHHYTKNIGAGR